MEMEENPLRREIVRLYIKSLAGSAEDEDEGVREYKSSYARWDALHSDILWVDEDEGLEMAVPLSWGEQQLLLSLEREGEYEELLAEMDRIACLKDTGR